LLLVGIWQMSHDSVISHLIVERMHDQIGTLSESQRNLLFNDVHNVIAGNVPASQVSPTAAAAAQEYQRLDRVARAALTVLALCGALGGGLWVWRRISPTMRARNRVEGIFELLLLACSTVAIFTTIGIVLSVLFEAIRFFNHVPVHEFIFGTQWSPQT